MKSKTTFYGHGWITIGINLFCALASPFLWYSIVISISGIASFNPLIIRLVLFFVFLYVACWLWFLPVFLIASCSYLCFEIKHVLFRDGIADTSLLGKGAFCVMSILGYLSGIATILVTIEHFPFLHGWVSLILIIPLSFLSALGGTIGLLDGDPNELIFFIGQLNSFMLRFSGIGSIMNALHLNIGQNDLVFPNRIPGYIKRVFESKLSFVVIGMTILLSLGTQIGALVLHF